LSKPAYGGQALIEGVMMRGQRVVVSAVRNPAGQIIYQTERLQGPLYDAPWSRWPFIRGPINLWDSMSLGVRALLFSANTAIDDGSSPEQKQAPASSAMVFGTMAFSVGMALLVFFAVPSLIASFMDSYQQINSPLISNLVEKGVRLVLLIGYIGLIGLMPDIRRVYAYHGAEHKAVNALEAGAPMDVADVQRFSTAHPRCGTSFLLFVVVISFVLFMFLGQPDPVFRVLSRIVLVPVVAAIAYELIRLAGKYQHNMFVHWLLAPGLWLQSMTTREPADDQVEVAIAALQRVIEEEAVLDGVQSPQAVAVQV
jgi:uncharacterized protein YqhQ